MCEFKPYRWEAEKTATNGQKYRVCLADHVLKDKEGHPEATMFSYSYLAENNAEPATDRPVVFAYNGGPGADSAWLHMGLLGPVLACMPGYPDKIARPAHFELTPNSDFLIDTCDIVLIDPVGTGCTRLLDGDTAKKHYSTGGDAQDFADFIVDWLEGNHREQSPVYLLGESYGTIRNVTLADVLPETVDLRGIIHVGTSLNVGALTTLLVEPNVRRLGADAAVCWYHHHRDECSREEFVRQAMDFAYGDYAQALLLGSRLDEVKRESVLERLSFFTNLDKELLDRQNLRFSEVDFLLECCPGSVVSTYDARLLYCPESDESYSQNDMESAGIIEPDVNQDAFMSSVGPVYNAALQQYAGEELRMPEREGSDDMMNIAKQWDYRSYDKDTLKLPVELMERRPELRMMFVNGYYDMQSTFDFVIYYLSQFHLPEDRVCRVVLPSGHASYVGDGMVNALSEEIRKFIKR